MINIDDIITYLDSSIVVVNKPSGLRTIPDGYNQEIINLQSLLKSRFPNLLTVHRLDKETSGLIIFALNNQSHRFLSTLFEQRKVQKRYYTITHSIPDWDEYIADFPLKIDADRKHRTRFHTEGKIAKTYLQKVEVSLQKNLSYMIASPKTGYTHQIRAHLSHLGFPILGDTLYSNHLSNTQKALNKSVDRMMLHAFSIEFTHPETDQIMILNSEAPFHLDSI
jgi:RluA family pseudouridine synthase